MRFRPMANDIEQNGRDAAHKNIGRFFCAFSELEGELNRAVSLIFGLQSHPAGEAVAAQLDIGRKIDLVRAAGKSATATNGVEFPEEWKSEADEALKRLHAINSDKRVPFAHGRLEALEDGQIRMVRTTARGGQLKQEQVYFDETTMQTTLDDIERCRVSLQCLNQRLSAILVKGTLFESASVFYDATVSTSSTSPASEDPRRS